MFFRFFCFFFLLIVSFPADGQKKKNVRPKIGLVLSGGAAKGIAHIGALKVFEEAGLTFDYIGGTSMGSIVGGLYAIGYDAESLEKMVLEQDWMALLSDQIPLSNISIEEKEEIRKYFISFPAEKLKIYLPTGLSTGQNINTLLSGLLLSYHDNMKFNTLPTPFLCVATDIINGKQEVFKEGCLVDAIRASMAIPSVFTPIEINGNLYVDGGMINNFPVKEVKEMGADIIVGVDCGFKSFKKEEINSLTNVLNQSLYVFSVGKNIENREMTDYLIEPDFKGTSAMDFMKAADLIKLGEDAARVHFDELKHLADSINNLYGERPFNQYKKVPDFTIYGIEIDGLQDVSQNLLMVNLKIRPPAKMTLEDLNAAINRVYGSQFFESVFYKIEKRDGKDILKLYVKEKTNVIFRFGAHYDTDFNASILLNGTFRNALIKGSKLDIDLKLGSNIAIDARYIVPTIYKSPKYIGFLFPPWKLGWFPELEIIFSNRNYETYEYTDGHRTGRFDYQNTTTGLYLKSNVSNSLEVGLGSQIEMVDIRPDIYYTDPVEINNVGLNTNFYIKAETYDKFVFPARGFRIFSKLELVKDIDDDEFSDVYRITARYNHAYPLSGKFTLLTNFYGGYLYGDSIPPDYLFYSGGLVLNDYKINIFPFVGMELFEKVNKNAMSIGLDLQYEFIRNHVIQLRTNVGKTSAFFEDLVAFEDINFGVGLTYGFRSRLGPIEFTIMKNSYREDVLTYVNIGYWF